MWERDWTTHMANDALITDRPRAMSLVNLLPLVALAVFGTLFIRHISSLDARDVWACLSMLAPWQWATALVFTALSFRAIGTYDVLVHKVLNTGQTPRAAHRAGIKAIALSQTLGFGAVTSALVRWRCLPDVSLGAIARLSALVSLSFLAALAVVAALVVPLSGLVPRSDMLIWGGVAAIAALAVLAKLAHHLGWIPAPLRGGTLLALLVATAADTAFAAAALWVLWPDAISFHLLFAAYLVALGAGLVSNAPGGVGAFDLTLLALIPAADDASAMAALLAFRMIYYALPATLALLGLLRPAQAKTAAPLSHPEAALLTQSANRFDHPKGPLLTLPSWGGGTVLGDLPSTMTLSDLRWGDPKSLYKCSNHQAITARRAGWTVLRCADEAVIDPQSWSLNGPSRRQLRRVLKAFDASGLRIVQTHDMDALKPVADTWAASHGGERGLTMGRYCPDYLRVGRVFVAYDGATPVAFASFHTGDVWTLDLMRHVNDIPSGTMHALICAGIAAAKTDRAARLSLAAVPAPAPHFPFAKPALRETAGLRRFKSAFGPNWQPRYICARNPMALALTMATLAIGIHRPAPLPRPKSVQPQHEDFSFAHTLSPCEPLASQLGAFAHDQRPLRPPRHA